MCIASIWMRTWLYILCRPYASIWLLFLLSISSFLLYMNSPQPGLAQSRLPELGVGFRWPPPADWAVSPFRQWAPRKQRSQGGWKRISAIRLRSRWGQGLHLPSQTTDILWGRRWDILIPIMLLRNFRVVCKVNQQTRVDSWLWTRHCSRHWSSAGKQTEKIPGLLL